MIEGMEEIQIGSNEGLAYLESLPEWNGKATFDFVNIKKVMEYLGNPQDIPASIHIAGTNGKGSVAAALESMLSHAGFLTGLITSPHLERINERIKLCGREIGDTYLSECIIKVKEASEKLNLPLTKHEVLTAASFEACRDMEWIVVEVGLGGRLDASNILKAPKAAAIVTIDYDHEAILGDTLAKIAAEKAGIIKNGETVVVGEVSDEALAVITKVAAEKKANIVISGKDFYFESAKNGEARYLDSSNHEIIFYPALLGSHQVHNMAVAAAVGVQIGLSPEAITAGIESCKWPGRLEKIKVGDSLVILDGAHNPAGMTKLISFLESEGLKDVEFIFGVFADKDWQKMIDIALPSIVNWNIVRVPSKRALDIKEMQQYLQSKGITTVNCYENSEEALKNCLKNGKNIVIAGSLSLIGDVRPKIKKIQ